MVLCLQSSDCGRVAISFPNPSTTNMICKFYGKLPTTSLIPADENWIGQSTSTCSDNFIEFGLMGGCYRLLHGCWNTDWENAEDICNAIHPDVHLAGILNRNNIINASS